MDLLRRAVLVAVVPMIGALAATTLWGWFASGPQTGKWVVPVMLFSPTVAIPFYAFLALVALVSWLLWSGTRLAPLAADEDRRQLHGVIQLGLTLCLVLALSAIATRSLEAASLAGLWYVMSGYPVWAFLAGFKWAPPREVHSEADPESLAAPR